MFWHGHCEQGNPTLCILMGKAVQKLPAAELQTISSVISKFPLTFFNKAKCPGGHSDTDRLRLFKVVQKLSQEVC